MSDPAPIHANLVAHFQRGRWRGLLLRGPSGAGKSALSMALVARGWRLVADDRVLIWRSGGQVWGRAPDSLQGLLEVRGIGVKAVRALGFSQIAWVMDCTTSADEVERIPEPAIAALCGVDLPACRVDALAHGAADRAAAFCDALRL